MRAKHQIERLLFERVEQARQRRQECDLRYREMLRNAAGLPAQGDSVSGKCDPIQKASEEYQASIDDFQNALQNLNAFLGNGIVPKDLEPGALE